MPKRPRLVATEFGEWIEHLRGERSHEAVAQKLRPYVRDAGLKIDRSYIVKLEQGRVPNWPVIDAISRAFEVPIMETTWRLVVSLGLARDPARHSGKVKRSPTSGGGDAAVEARVRELQARIHELEAYEAIVRQIRPHLSSIIALIGEEGDAIAGTKTGRGRGDRKTD